MAETNREPREEEPSVEEEARPGVSLWSIFSTYLKIGLTAFGFSILPKVRRTVVGNGWLSEEEVNDGLGRDPAGDAGDQGVEGLAGELGAGAGELLTVRGIIDRVGVDEVNAALLQGCSCPLALALDDLARCVHLAEADEAQPELRQLHGNLHRGAWCKAVG